MINAISLATSGLANTAQKALKAADNIVNADTRDVHIDEELVNLKQAEYGFKANLATIRIATAMHETLQNALSESER